MQTVIPCQVLALLMECVRKRGTGGIWLLCHSGTVCRQIATCSEQSRNMGGLVQRFPMGHGAELLVEYGDRGPLGAEGRVELEHGLIPQLRLCVPHANGN